MEAASGHLLLHFKRCDIHALSIVTEGIPLKLVLERF
jgi:hypothetical protein